MILNFILLCTHLFLSMIHCQGINDTPFFDDIPVCSTGNFERSELPFYEIQKSTIPSYKTLGTIFSPDTPSHLPYIPEINELSTSSRETSTSPFYSQLRLKKRSISDSEENMKFDEDGQDRYEYKFMTPLLREVRDKVDIKTIQIPPSFTPRLGRKRSEDAENPDSSGSYMVKNKAQRSHVIDLKAGNAFTPRLGRSENSQKVRFHAGSAFTPTLRKSEDSQRISFQAGSAFTPRLGRSSDFNMGISNARTPFIPKQGRSEGSNRIGFNVGNTFTPRLGRSGSSSRSFNAGSSFTPRLGRSEDPQKVQLNAGNAFTPRLG